MKKALLVLNAVVCISVLTILGMSYLAITHPLLTVGTAFIGLNLVLLTIFKLG